MADCNLPPMDDNNITRTDDEDVFRPRRPMGLVSEEKTLLEGEITIEDLVDYLLRI